MKLIFVIFAICIIGFTQRKVKSKSSSSRYLAKNYMKDQKDPREIKTSNYLALYQTVFARNMIYFPSDSLKSELSLAAAELIKYVDRLDNDHAKALGGRLLNSEGIMKGKSDVDLKAAIGRVSDNSASATDREVFIAMLGDIGALFADTGATTGVEGRTPKQAGKLREEFINFITLDGKPNYFDEARTAQVKKFGGSLAVGPNKGVERTRKKDGEKEVKETRSGIFNFGDAADEIVKVTEGKIEKTTWAVALIKDERLNTQEPWAGHMSGSPAEILHTWDVLRGTDPTVAYTKNLNDWFKLATEQRSARAAGAAGFLVSMGYHSAMECVEGTFNYLGQNLRNAEIIKEGEDAGHVFKNGASTYILSGLFNDFSSTKLNLETVKSQIEDKAKTLKKIK